MTTFNDSLKAGSVVVAIDHIYDDNNGAQSVAYVLSVDNELDCVNYSNGHTGLAYDAAKVDATEEQKAIAANIYIDDLWKAGRKDEQGNTDLTGTTVILQRSRKAENKVELLVLDYAHSYYCNTHYHYVTAKIKVNGKDGEPVWVNESCVKEIKKGLAPFWAK
jgi:hypothetical protein